MSAAAFWLVLYVCTLVFMVGVAHLTGFLTWRRGIAVLAIGSLPFWAMVCEERRAAARSLAVQETIAVAAAPAPTPVPMPTTWGEGILKIPMWQQMGHQLMECRIKVSRIACTIPGPDCEASKKAITGDGIFDALRGAQERLDWLDVVARVDDELARCKLIVGEPYTRKVVG